MTLREALAAAALEGFASKLNTHDGGWRMTLVQPGVPEFSRSYDWGDEDRAVADVQAHVAEYRHRREDDPRVQHEGVYEGGY